FWPDGLRVILPYVINAERRNRFGGRLPKGGIFGRKQRDIQRVARTIARAAKLPGDKLRRLRLQDAEGLIRERGIQLIIGQQLHTPRDRKSTRLNSSHVKISY